MTALMTENLSLISGAPNGIAKLRDLILLLAVHGKLVSSADADSPVSTFLSDIENAREQHELSPGARNRSRAGQTDAMAEPPYQGPDRWQWCSLGSLLNITGGVTLGRKLGGRELISLPYLRVANVQRGFLVLDQIKEIEVPADEVDKYKLASGDLLTTEGGDWDKVGRTAIWRDEIAQCLHQNHVFRLRPYTNRFSSRWVEVYLNSAPARRYFAGSSKQTTNLASINMTQLRACAFPVPPLAEQHRIVAKVDELMALCDRLEAEQTDAEAAHAKLVEALVASLTQARDAADFRASWQQLAEHFHTLFTTEASVDALKQAVLQLGVMGKLVVQNQMEEPACKLLERLARDRRESSAELKFTDTKLSSPTQSESFELPPGWAWTTLASLFRVITDGDHQAPPRTEQGVAFLTIGNITAGKLDFDGCRQVEPTYFEALPTYRKPGRGDLLYTVVGATYGRPVLVDSDRPFCVQRHIAILKRSEHLSDRFALYLLKSPLVYRQASNCVTGTAQPTIPLKPLRNFNVPLPPLAEQHRIVAKVDELLGLCDQLKQNLATARQSHERLASVLVEQAVA